ncbi:M13 family metallopeptidase [Bryobacter aggregatus]|uniref:M13 family metallopeptidase n=1 Tax=Bryobacter aggregatus TaxID=360054 RepID=UPI0004E1EE2A|nr:M13 family metallopeptidase [Bryobacter aggregatus]
MKCLSVAGALLSATFILSAQKKSGIDILGIDKTCQPCEDFWRYASGKWMESNPIPPSQAGWGPVAAMADQNRERLKVLLDEAADGVTSTGSGKKIGDLYRACMDTEQIEKLGASPLRSQLAKINKIEDAASLASYFKEQQAELGGGPFGIAPRQDLKNTEVTGVYVGPSGLSLPTRDYYFEQDARTTRIREEFVQHAARMLALLGQDGDGIAAAKKILEFETQLAQPQLTNIALRDPYATYHPMGVKGLSELTPGMDWRGVLALMHIPEDTLLVVAQPEYQKVLEKLMQSTPSETWRLWLRWKTVSQAAPNLSKAYAEESFYFSGRLLSGLKEAEPRWKTCTAVIDTSMGDALGELFVKKHFPPAAKQRMLDLVENLRATLKDELANSKWMSPETKKSAVAKLEAFRPKIGYPDRWRDYSSVSISRADFFGSLRAAQIASRAYALSKVGKARDRNDWGMTPPTVNAYYNPTQNEIAFPAGILQPPIFDLAADDAANYGAAGAVIGHEMGHGFDDQGSKFAANGNLQNWWTDADRKEFDARAACVIEEFDSLDLGDNLRHKGKFVVGEAMGDLGGLKIAYKAYKKTLHGKPSPVIDGYTGEQRFFLAFARVWATQLRPENLRLRLTNDPHPIARWRAIGTLQNMPEFHEAFQCKPGDFMVRPVEKQCKVW